MDFEDLKRLYLKKREQLGPNTYRHISELLRDAKELHREDWLKHPTPGGDHEQSWRAFKGKNLEKLVQYFANLEGNILKELRSATLFFESINRLAKKSSTGLRDRTTGQACILICISGLFTTQSI